MLYRKKLENRNDGTCPNMSHPFILLAPSGKYNDSIMLANSPLAYLWEYCAVCSTHENAHGHHYKIVVFPLKNEGHPKLRPTMTTNTYATHIHNNFG